MYHVGKVRRGQRRAFSLALVWEIPTALGMGLIGQGVSDWLGLGATPGLALITTLSYLGPRALEEAFDAVLARVRRGEGEAP